MRVITEREVIQDVKQRWRSQYPRDDFRFLDGTTARSKWEKLQHLDENTCSRSDIDAAIGTSGWGDLKCDQCGQHSARIVRLGAEPDYEARWLDLCGNCLNEAIAALDLTNPDVAAE